MKIIKLSSEHLHVLQIARWLFDEWGHLRPGATLESTIERLRGNCGADLIPSVYAAEVEQQPVGTLSLVEHDMAIRPERTPWISAVYVAPEWRGRGVGGQLMRYAEQLVFAAGIDRLYLFTDGKQRLYSRLGWRAIEELHYHGLRVTVMNKFRGEV